MSDSGEASIQGVAVDDLRAYLADAPVEFAILFGSHARGTADEASDVDVVLHFPDDLDDRERFRLRNRIDAEVQAYAEGFVDVSDIDALPVAVARTALREGIVLVGDERAVDEHRRRLEREYEASADREQERREFIDRLASGDV